MCALNFDPSPYLQLYQQRREAENQPPPWANASQNIMSGLDLLLREKRQRELMDMEREKLNFSRNQQLFENENKYGKDPAGIDIGVQGGIGQSSFMPGSLPRGVEGPQPAMKMGTNMPLVEALNKFRAGGLKPSAENAQLMPYLGQEERNQYYENANPKPLPQYQIISPDQSGIYPSPQLQPGVKPVMAPRQSSSGKQGVRLSSPDAEAAFKLYETARDGLLSGLEGSITGTFLGRIPSVTANQQIAEGGVAAMAPVLKQLFRVAGEGVFTDRDQALLLQMIPTRATKAEAREEQIKNIDNIVKAKLGIKTDLSEGPKPGAIEDGYEFIGGNPSDPNSWRPIQ